VTRALVVGLLGVLLALAACDAEQADDPPDTALRHVAP
jgi:hypothetical protein